MKTNITYDDFEDWEDDYELYYKEDWENLLKLRLHRKKKFSGLICPGLSW